MQALHASSEVFVLLHEPEPCTKQLELGTAFKELRFLLELLEDGLGGLFAGSLQSTSRQLWGRCLARR